MSIKPNTNWEEMQRYIKYLDLVLVMTVEPGFGGQGFLVEQLDKVTKLRKYIDSNNLAAMISVDGGIDKETASLVKKAGADILVSGSYIFEGSKSYKEKIKDLRG